MNRVWVLKSAIGLLLLLYPVFIYFGLKEYSPGLLATVIFAMAAIRWAVSRNDGPLKAYGPYLVMAPALVVGATFITDSNLGLFLYPALVNLVFFVFFSISLFYPPTVVEQLARWRQPDFPSEAISYTTKVTKVWCLFFVINGALSLLSLQLSEEWWLLYNGLIAYLFMGGLFAVEYLVRLRVMSRLYG